MPASLIPRSPLTQVIFALDYVQLVFEEERFSLYNSVMVCSGDTGLQRSERGFADALVSMLGKRVISATATEAEPLSIVFTDGTEIRVFKDSEGANPEAFAFTRWDGEIVVEQND